MAEQGASTRRRNAADSRERLLEAAGELFAEHGYDRTTVREVGQRAGVDPALIARYFGSKGALYLASLRREGQPSTPLLRFTDASSIEGLLVRMLPKGPSPTMYAAIRPHEDAELQTAAMELLVSRVLAPAVAQATEAGLDDVQLRAEILAAALAGIVLSRSSGAFDTLSQAPAADVGRLVADLLGGILTGPSTGAVPSHP